MEIARGLVLVNISNKRQKAPSSNTLKLGAFLGNALDKPPRVREAVGGEVGLY